MRTLLKFDPLPKKDGGDGTGKPPTDAGAPAAGAGTPRRDRARRPRRRRRGGGDDDTGAAAEHAATPAAADAPTSRPPDTEPRARARRGGDGHQRRRRRTGGDGTARPRRATPRARPRSPGGHGRETSREPSAQNRHGSSAALVIPIRGPVTYARPAGRRRIDATGPSTQVDVSFSLEPDPQRLGELARAVAQSSRAPAAARAHQRPGPRSGSSARISTAAPTPSGSQTAFSSAWMP